MPSDIGFDAIRLERLVKQADSILASIQALGPHGAAVNAPDWLKQLVAQFLSEVHKGLPDPDFFVSISPSVLDLSRSAEVASRIETCWQAGVLLHVAVKALGEYVGEPKAPIGFSSEMQKQTR